MKSKLHSIQATKVRKICLKFILELIKIISTVPKNCHQYGKDLEDGIYTIDPLQKEGSDSKLEAKCKFDEGVTIIEHDSPEEFQIEPCSTNKCFNHTLNYETNLPKIANLISISEECYQRIEFSCFNSKFSFASFASGNGNYHEFFNGDDQTQCDCSHGNNTCFSLMEQNLCNCNMYDPTSRNDTITITDKVKSLKIIFVDIHQPNLSYKEKLPLTTFYYGWMHLASQRASAKIGPLICKGTIPPTTSVQTCEDHKNIGNPSGYYTVESGYCIEKYTQKKAVGIRFSNQC